MKTTCLSLLLAVLLNTASAASAPAPAQLAIGAALPAYHLDPLAGPASTLTGWRGKPMLINVWASWCGPCRAEMGSLQRLSQRHAGRLQVIGVSTDDHRQLALAFLRSARTSFPNYLDHALQLERLLGADRIPLTLLIDARGRVRGRFYGSREWDSADSVALISRTLGLQL